VYDPYILLHRIDLETAAVQRKIVESSSADVAEVVALALEMDSNNSTVHETIARLRLADGKLPEAQAAIQRAIALRPRQPRYHALHGDVLRALGDLALASEAYREEASVRVKGTAEWRSAQHKLMVTLAERGRYEAVVTEGQSVVAVAEDDLAYTLIGIAQQSMNRPDLAREAFAQALRINPANVNARQALDGATVNRIHEGRR
jgi:tetratricopeptide (TPR) repeat protein